MNRIAIFLHHGLGDVIMALPALWAVDRIGGSGLTLDIVVKSSLEARIITSVDWQGKLRLRFIPAGSRLERALQTARVIWGLRRSRPHALVTPHLSDPISARQIARLIGARVSVLPGPMTPAPGEHKAVYYGRFFREAGLDIDLDTLEFPPLEPRESSRRVLLAPAVGAAREQHKKWPNERFAALASHILATRPDISVELVGAPLEAPILQDVFDRLSETDRMRVTMRTEPGVRDAAQAMVGAEAIVTACSGASHLAAWAGIAVVGLYGPTNPLFTGPFTRRLYPVYKGYSCAPCYRPTFISGCSTPFCMNHISVDEAFAALSAALDGSLPPNLPQFPTSQATAPNLNIIAGRLSDFGLAQR